MRAPLKRLAETVLPFLLILALAGCGKKASEEIDFGTVKDSIYRNKYFGLSVKMPDGWNVQDQEAQKRATQLGTELMAGDDKNFKQTMKKAIELQTATLFAVSEHPLGAPVDFNPNLLGQAERIRGFPGIKRGSDYFFHVRKALESSQFKMRIKKEYGTEVLGGVSFDTMESESTFGKTVIRQKFYTAIRKDYALNFIASYTTDEQEASLHDILGSVKFEPKNP